MVLRVFPVDPKARVQFSDTYGAPRDGGRTHEGEDIFAPEGTPVLAVDDGRVRFDENQLGGHTAYVKSNDGTSYYYAHLSAYEGAARKVRAGDVIGYVGHTGNAAHTAPHLHFEIHPLGGRETIRPFDALLRAAQGDSGPVPPARVAKRSNDGWGWLLVLYALSRRAPRG